MQNTNAHTDPQTANTASTGGDSGATVGAEVVGAANEVLGSLHGFQRVVGLIQQGVAQLQTETMAAKGKIDVHVVLAEQRIDAHIQQRLAGVMQAAGPNMDYIERELKDRRRRSSIEYDDY